MTLQAFIEQVKIHPENIEFSNTMEVIDSNYDFTPTEFSNGQAINEADQNNGSCKIFAFAQLNQLNVKQTLACFGQYYRIDVLQYPENEDHQNIRNFMMTGWEGIYFKNQALQLK